LQMGLQQNYLSDVHSRTKKAADGIRCFFYSYMCSVLK
jgi:hypothetical protein